MKIDTTSNRAYWEMKLNNALHRFEYKHFDPFKAGVPEIRRIYASMTDATYGIATYGVEFLANDREEESNQLFRLAVVVGEEVVRVSEFGPPDGFDVDTRRHRAYDNLFLAKWLCSGVRDIALGKERTALSSELLRRAKRQYEKKGMLEWFLWDSVEIDDFEEAKRVYRESEPKPVPVPPKSAGYLRSEASVLYLLSEYASGNTEAKKPAENAVRRWYGECHDWSDTIIHDPPIIMDAVRKAYLYGRHLGGPTTPKEIIMDIRGF